LEAAKSALAKFGIGGFHVLVSHSLWVGTKFVSQLCFLAHGVGVLSELVGNGRFNEDGYSRGETRSRGIPVYGKFEPPNLENIFFLVNSLILRTGDSEDEMAVPGITVLRLRS
jgi:hypothetical protein